MINREVQVVTDSSVIAETTETIRTEVTVLTEIRVEATITDRVDRQKEKSHTVIADTTAETIAETAATTETGATKEAETDTVAETKIETEIIAEIGNPAMRDNAQIRETDFRKTYRDRKIGMTRTGTEEITVRGHTIRTKKRTVGNA